VNGFIQKLQTACGHIKPLESFALRDANSTILITSMGESEYSIIVWSGQPNLLEQIKKELSNEVIENYYKSNSNQKTGSRSNMGFIVSQGTSIVTIITKIAASLKISSDPVEMGPPAQITIDM
jgi:hypothetical protein